MDRRQAGHLSSAVAASYLALSAIVSGCASSIPLDKPAVEELVRAFNFWTDKGLYSRKDLQHELGQEAAKVPGQQLMPDMAAHAREIEKLLAPYSRIYVDIEGKEQVQDRAEFVSLIQRSRFMWQVKEGLLEEPRIEISGERAVVQMTKFHLEPARKDGAYVYDCRLIVRSEGGRLVATESREKYRKATVAEAERMATLPEFAEPAGFKASTFVTTPEGALESLDQTPPRRAKSGEVEAWVRQLEAKEKSAGSRALAAFNLGSFGPGAAEAVPALTKALTDEKSPVRRASAEALRKIGPSARPAIPVLRTLLEDENGDVRFQAQRTLDRLEQASKN